MLIIRLFRIAPIALAAGAQAVGFVSGVLWFGGKALWKRIK